MKNIAQYFEDSTKPNGETPMHSNDDTKEKPETRNGSKGKRNRVKIKISRSNTKERVCNILESSSDMIDKTPSPFAKVNVIDGHQHETPKRSLPKLLSPTKQNKSSNQYSNYLTSETNNVNAKNKRQRKEDDAETCTNENKKNKNELNKKTKNNDNVKHDAEITVLLDTNSNDGPESSQDGSNAFQILMNRTKSNQNTTLTKPSPQNEEVNVKKSEECKEKLKHTKDKLIALADKKGYSKRKLAEIEESERIERTIQNRIKLFKGEDKKEDCVTNVLNQKQSPGSLLNYFSRKSPMDLRHNNIATLSTIVVQADVHVTENNVKHSLCSLNKRDGIHPNRKSRRSHVELSQMDDICIVESENINISSNKKQLQDELHMNKRRWSLRIKLQTNENGNNSLGESSDEELFSPKSKIKLNAKNSMESGVSNKPNSENLPIRNKTQKGMSKQTNNGHVKLKLKRHEQLEHLEDIVTIQHDSCSGNKLKDKSELMKVDKHTITSVNNTKLNNNMNLRNIEGSEINHEDCIIISDNNSKRKTTDKLAPLFTKRRKPDPETVAARRLFLQPDITDNNNKGTNRKINVCGILAFPLISHITQLNDTTFNKSNFFNIPREISNKYIPILSTNSFKHLMDFSETKVKPLGKVNKPKLQDALMDIEKRCSNAKQIWDIISSIAKEQSKKIVSTKERPKKSKVLEKKETAEYNSKKEEHLKYCSWIFKYRPKSTQEVVGNEDAARKLKQWLLGWNATFTTDNVSSGDEFYSSDSNHSKIIENNQVAVLLGPHGCGKTASVYAVAEEFGYTVLELNASSRRTGKKILRELEEATKSHRIKKDERTLALCTLTSDEIMPKKIPQNSLILIEDVDIVFEEDEGFVSATYQLASNTKRPIAMTCRDVCPHLNRIAPQQNRIYFQDAVGNRVSALLELISLAETGYRLPSSYITELLQNGDLRKAILQLQYLLLSGPPQMLELSINFKNAFWQNMRHYLYKPAIKLSKKRKRKGISNNEVSTVNKTIINEVANKLDNIALLSSLVNVQDSALNLWQIKAQPNLSLVENDTLYSASRNLCSDIAEWIGGKVFYQEQLNENDGVQWQNTIMLKKKLNEGVNLALSQTTSLILDRHILATDYLPSVRNICRAENSRATMNNKRGNRFFHYLHNLKATSTLLKPNILATACKTMHDKVDSSAHTSEDNTGLI